ncbi:MAG: helix-turn-helix domain-containing protein [Pseudomonadota bacterium]
MSETHDHQSCPMDSLLRLLMGSWTTYILWLLGTEGTLRFGQLKALMPKISSKVLTDRLRHLERAGLVHRDYRPTIPPTVSYSLTARALELREVLEGLNDIALRWREEDERRELSA